MIGNGAIAQQIQTKRDLLSEGNLYFASGVANSGNTTSEEFEREVKLFRKQASIHSADKTIVYFSSLGIFDLCRKTQPYFVHKKFMETLVQRCPNHCIIRLGELVGQTKNTATLTNYFYANLVNGRTTRLFTNALRAPTDIESLVSFLVRKQGEFGNLKVVNLVPPFLYSPVSIYLKLAQVIKASPKFRLDYRSEFFGIPTDNVYKPEDLSSVFITKDRYLEELLAKYYA